MAMLKCENCGAPLEPQGGQRVVQCPYCGHKQAVSAADAEAFNQAGFSYAELLETTKKLIAEGDFPKAKRYCLEAREAADDLDIRPDYLWLLIQAQAKDLDELIAHTSHPLNRNPLFRKVFDLADSEWKEQLKKADEQSVENWKIQRGKTAKKRRKVLLIASIAVVLVAAVGLGAFFYITRDLLPKQHFQEAQESFSAGNIREAIAHYATCKGICPDAKLDALWRETERCSLSAGDVHAVALTKDGKVLAAGSNQTGQCQVDQWADIASVSAGAGFTLALKNDGTCVAVGDNSMGQCAVNDWKDVVAVSAGTNHSVALLRDGTCVAVGDNKEGQCNIKGWKDIVSISAGGTHTVGIKADGSVVATKFLGDFFDDENQCEVSGWKNVIALSAGEDHTSGLMQSGRFCFAGRVGLAYQEEARWTDLKAIDSGENHLVGLKKDGTVLVSSEFRYQFFFEDVVPTDRWRDVAYVAAGRNFVVAVKQDGTPLFASKEQKTLEGLSEWKTALSDRK